MRAGCKNARLINFSVRNAKALGMGGRKNKQKNIGKTN